MSYEIREATQDERDRFVRSTWRRSFARSRRYTVTGIGSYEYVSMRGESGARLHRDLWLLMHAETIAHALASEMSVAVAAIGDECLGWVAWGTTQGIPHYVYVAPRFRRKGIGAALLRTARSAGAVGAPSHLTYEGEQLLAHVLRQQPGATHESQQGQAVHDG